MRWISRLRRSLVRDPLFRDPLFRDQRGASALEYALIAAVIGGILISAVTSFGNSLTSAYSTIGGALTTQANSV